MAALIAPRPFMVERGHFDGVASDETVGWEYAKVRFLYAAKLKIPERTAIEWFDGPHSINGVGTLRFFAAAFKLAACGQSRWTRTTVTFRNGSRITPVSECPQTFDTTSLGRRPNSP